MDKCPYCGADTRPGDNFCLNCGNRLLTTTPSSSQQAPTAMSESTLAAPDDWGGAVPGSATTVGWVEGPNSSQTVADSAGPDPSAGGSYEPTVRESSSPTAQATAERIEQPAHFTLRAENGDILQEYPLDKYEITIGRAPNSDILLSKDKLTSRRHATVRYENNQYVLYDEHSANGTLVNGQQMEDGTPHVLNEADHVGIGEHDLVFHSVHNHMADLPTIAVPQELTYRTQADALATLTSQDEFGTATIDSPEEPVAAPAVPVTPQPPEPEPIVASYSSIPDSSVVVPPPEPVVSTPRPTSSSTNSAQPVDKTTIGMPTSNAKFESGVNFNRLTDLPSPALPDISALMAALSTLDGQVMSLQEQINSSQDAMRNHEAEIVQTTNQLRSSIRNVSDRMDSTIADVARSREALAWAELLQLMEDVMNNPRDIEYVTKLARKARELNKVFQIHQNVLNTMAECNSLLRSMIGENR